LVIINDGSNDNTKDEIHKFKDERIIYLEQSNSGQLNAIFKSLKYLTGDLVMLLHSDDLLTNHNAIEKNIKYFRDNNIDGIYCDLVKIDESGKPSGVIKVAEKICDKSPVYVLASYGSNIIPDTFFCTMEFLKKNIFKNYCLWNIPYWLIFQTENIDVPILKKSIYPWYKYRVYSGNYIQSDLGKFVVTNGCLRSVLQLSKYYYIPWNQIQNLAYRISKKIIFFKKRERDLLKHNKLKIISKTIKQRYGNIPNDLYYSSIVQFYKNISCREITLQSPLSTNDLIFGKDANIFFNLMNDNKLPEVYHEILQEAYNGFSKVVVNNLLEKQILDVILMFLNLEATVEIKSK
jgi:glycosyltransferase involved in cell wall biosynthesis